MDDLRFDTLSRVFATAPTRRTALAGLAALLSRAFLAPADANAQSRICRPLGDRCFPSRGLDCCRGECRSGRCRCPEGQRRCGNRCLRKGRSCRRRSQPRRGCRSNQKRCRGRCIAKNACCGGCPNGQVCRYGGCCNVTTTKELEAALTAGGPDTIRLCPKTTYQGPFWIERQVTVIGAGANSSVLDGAGYRSVVTITDDVTETVHLQKLGIVNGMASLTGGGIDAYGPLTITRCRVANNEAGNVGGGIMTRAALTLVDSVVAGNRVGSSGTGLGGGIYVNNEASLMLQGNSRVEDNECIADNSSGGGIYAQNGADVTLRDQSLVRRNEAHNGGGITFLPSSTVRLRDNSRVEANTARGRGGGVYGNNGSLLELHGRSVITNNKALGGANTGGGIFSFSDTTVVLPNEGMVVGNTPDQCWLAIPTGDGGTCS